MRLSLATVIGGALVGCIPSARVILPADAPIAQVKAPPAPAIEEAAAQEETSSDGVFEADAKRPCTDAADAEAARKALDGLDRRIYGLDDNAPAVDLKRATDELGALLATPCFELAAADLPDALTFDTGLSIKHWWMEGMGRQAIDSYVQGGPFVRFVVPEAPRPSLIRQGNERHPLAALLCPTGDGKCGREADGWLRRMKGYFARPSRNVATDTTACEAELKTVAPTEAWSTFLGCVVNALPRQTVLPHGRFKGMTDGLFVIGDDYHGRCERLDVYDLATGTAIRARDCGTAPTVEIGRVPLAAIREAAWAITIGNVAKPYVRVGGSFEVPKTIVAGRPRENESGERFSLGGFYSTNRRHPWMWLRSKNGKMVGEVNGEIWGTPSHDAAEYAAELLEIARDGFDDTCAPAVSTSRLASIDWSAPGPLASEKDGRVPFAFDKPEYAAAVNALTHAKAPPRCKDPL